MLKFSLTVLHKIIFKLKNKRLILTAFLTSSKYVLGIIELFNYFEEILDQMIFLVSLEKID